MEDVFNISSDGLTLFSVKAGTTGVINVPQGITHIESGAFRNLDIREVVLPSSLKTIGECVFYDCRKLLSITIPEGVEKIPFGSFSLCDSLVTVRLPKTLSAIESFAFHGCHNLSIIKVFETTESFSGEKVEVSSPSSVTLPDCLESIGDYAFLDCFSLNGLSLPIGLKTISHCAFRRCLHLGYVFIPESLSTIDSSAFSATNVYIEVDENNPYYSSIDGSLYDKKEEVLINYHANSPYCYIDSPKALKRIERSAFDGLSVLREVDFGIPIEEVGFFRDCSNLKKLILPKGIRQFGGCTCCFHLDYLFIPDNVEIRGGFRSCSSLKKIRLPEGLERLRDDFFRECENLEEISLPATTVFIGKRAFKGCKNIKEIIIPRRVEEVSEKAFMDCISLEKVTCLSDNIRIAPSAFCGCVKLRHLEINSFRLSDLYLKYANCINLEEITYLDSDGYHSIDVKSIRNSWKTGPLYLFFDTETTGLPEDYNAPSSDIDNWPRLVQLAWILSDGKGNRINTGNFIIQPDGFSIPTEASRIHGITTSMAEEAGVPLTEAITRFKTDLDLATFIVGHNVSFDKKIVGAEMVRLNMEDTLDLKKSICTMQSSINLCKLPGYYGYKYPKLQELYIELFGERFDKAHNAMSDIEATEKCFWELKRLKWI